MFNLKFWEKKQSHIDEEIDRCLNQMELLSSDSEEYTKMASNLEVLYKARVHSKELGNGINPNTLVTVGGSIASVVLILFWEQAGNVITSRATNFTPKIR